MKLCGTPKGQAIHLAPGNHPASAFSPLVLNQPPFFIGPIMRAPLERLRQEPNIMRSEVLLSHHLSLPQKCSVVANVKADSTAALRNPGVRPRQTEDCTIATPKSAINRDNCSCRIPTFQELFNINEFLHLSIESRHSPRKPIEIEGGREGFRTGIIGAAE